MNTGKVSPGTRVFSIVDHGARADGTTVNTTAIQAALDACGAAGGGTVVVPAGTFVTGTIWLRSHVELHLQHGAVLLASPDHADYNAEDAYPQNWGPANIYGTAHSRPTRVRLRNIDLTVVPRPASTVKLDQPPATLLEFVGADDLRLENVRVAWKTGDPGWVRTLAMRHCTGVTITEDCRLAEPPPVAGK